MVHSTNTSQKPTTLTPNTGNAHTKSSQQIKPSCPRAKSGPPIDKPSATPQTSESSPPQSTASSKPSTTQPEHSYSPSNGTQSAQQTQNSANAYSINLLTQLGQPGLNHQAKNQASRRRQADQSSIHQASCKSQSLHLSY